MPHIKIQHYTVQHFNASFLRLMHYFKTASSELLESGQKHKLLNHPTPTKEERNKYITNRSENEIVCCLKNAKDFKNQGFAPTVLLFVGGLSTVRSLWHNDFRPSTKVFQYIVKPTWTSYHKLYEIHPSIIIITTYPIQGHSRAGAYPSWHWAKGRVPLDKSPVHRTADI